MHQLEVIALLIVTSVVICTYVRVVKVAANPPTEADRIFTFERNLAKICLLMVLTWLAGLIGESVMVRLLSLLWVIPLALFWHDRLHVGDNALRIRRGLVRPKEHRQDTVAAFHVHPIDEFDYGKRSLRCTLLLRDGTKRSLAGLSRLPALIETLRSHNWPVECTADLTKYEWGFYLFGIPTLSLLLVEWLFVFAAFQ